MIGSIHRQSSLFYVALGHQASLIKDDLLQPLDALLDDEALVELVRERLAARNRLSTKAGREGIAPDRLLRCCVLKHLKSWSFRDLERELRGSLVYRKFTRFDDDDTPTYSAFNKLFKVLGPKTTRAIHERVVAQAREEKIAPGRKLRIDTTVVESNVHYPTDSSLLGDGIRVLTRHLGRIAAECDSGAVKVVDHARAVKYRLLEIGRAAKSLVQSGKEKLKASYAKLVGLARQVTRQAACVTDQLAGRVRKKLRVTGDVLRVEAAHAMLERFVPLVQRVIRQTKERVLEGNTRAKDKLLSLFETYTAVIRKGKAHKPNEFGQLVRIDEVENGIVSNYDVRPGNPSDKEAWLPAIFQHKAQFGSVPRLATADRGFFSAKNERVALESGVARVALPATGRLSVKRARLQKQRPFRRLLKWRAGVESRISTLKNRFDMVRARYKSAGGFEFHVGWSVITNNLVSLARGLVKRKRRQEEQREKDNG
jgi:IS5 family transposase